MNTIHPTAIIEEGVSLGEDTSVWDNVHIRRDASIGRDCIIGEKTYIAYGVRIGNHVKINASVYICAAVEIEDGAMISAGTVFTNDRFPRAATEDLDALLSSDPDEHTLSTRVRTGATIGANATIGPGITIGRWSMVGMGSVVTRSVPDHHLVVGNPARSIGVVCSCGRVLMRFNVIDDSVSTQVSCNRCGHVYGILERRVSQLIAVS